MEKIKVKSISKSEFRSCYYFEKVQGFFEFARNFMVDLDLDKVQVNDLGRPINKDTAETILDKEENIKDYISRIDNFRSELYSVDIISFSDKIVMIINSKKDKQQEIVKILEKYVDW